MTHGQGVMRKALTALLALVVGAVIFVVARELNQAATPVGEANVADQVQEGLKLAAARIRPTLPKKIDDATTLREVSAAGMVLTYHYVVDRDNYELLPSFMQTAQRITTALLCNTEDTKGAMRAGAAYEYRYGDTGSKSLGGFVVTSADCE
jgi:hypothetical protein